MESVCERLNEALGITASNAQHIVFVYSAPKVGSTTIVSSLRLFCSHFLHVVHVHDEAMLSRVADLPPEFKVHDWIAYNRHVLGKKVHVIDVYRTPVERKISLFFEHLATRHFNNAEDCVNRYSVDRVIRRFAALFPHLGTDDRFLEAYPLRLDADTGFDHVAKCLRVERDDGIVYLKLRLQDAAEHWSRILSAEFGCRVCIVRDNDTARKPLGDLMSRFRDAYRIPVDVLESECVLACPHLRFYLSAEEQAEYAAKWRARVQPGDVSGKAVWWTREQFLFYEAVSRENAWQDEVQTAHYIDEGCRCKACSWQRTEAVARVVRGEPVLERLTHVSAKQKWLERCAERVRLANQVVAEYKKNASNGGKGEAAAAVARIMDTAVRGGARLN